MIILLMLMACVMLVIVKGIQVQKDLRERCYCWRSAPLVVIAFIVIIPQSLRSACGDWWGCSYSLRIGWLADHLRQLPFLDRLSADALLTITFYMVGLLIIYFLGHVLGWLIYGTQQLMRRVA